MESDTIILESRAKDPWKGICKGEDNEKHGGNSRVVTGRDFGNIISDMKRMLDQDLCQKA